MTSAVIRDGLSSHRDDTGGAGALIVQSSFLNGYGPAEAGFRVGDVGTHTSRTIMLAEVQTLLDYCRADASREEYVSAILEDNCLGKRTEATRRLTTQRLSELYALDPEVLLFRVMRRCWYVDESGRPLIAALLSLARDPLFRLTVPLILSMRPGEELDRRRMETLLDEQVRGRLSEPTVQKVVRNAASSWTQAGHLKGRRAKLRQTVRPTVLSTAFALFLGYLNGARGEALFHTIWAKVLDAPPSELMQLAIDARRLGFLDMSHSGGVVDMRFSKLLQSEERL